MLTTRPWFENGWVGIPEQSRFRGGRSNFLQLVSVFLLAIINNRHFPATFIWTFKRLGASAEVIILSELITW